MESFREPNWAPVACLGLSQTTGIPLLAPFRDLRVIQEVRMETMQVYIDVIRVIVFRAASEDARYFCMV